jgi:hypothetical protein
MAMIIMMATINIVNGNNHIMEEIAMDILITITDIILATVIIIDSADLTLMPLDVDIEDMNIELIFRFKFILKKFYSYYHIKI